MHRPLIPHWAAIKRVLRYLKHTIHYGILLTRAPHSSLVALGDVDWAGDSENRRSTMGHCIYFGSNLISWGSRRQTTVARSSTEAEYRALANTTSELTWITILFRELGIHSTPTPVILCDNIGATYMAANPVFHARTRHVKIDFHFVREKVVSKTIHVCFVNTKDQLADIFTKPLSIQHFEPLRDKLRVCELPLRSRGRVNDNLYHRPDFVKGDGDKMITF